jgi:hypothetical protein
MTPVNDVWLFPKMVRVCEECLIEIRELRHILENPITDHEARQVIFRLNLCEHRYQAMRETLRGMGGKIP